MKHTTTTTAENPSLDPLDGRHGRMESVKVKVWWEALIEGRVWNSAKEATARDAAERARAMGLKYELRRVEATTRTETVLKVEVLSSIDGS